jgi:hypothetical protein
MKIFQLLAPLCALLFSHAANSVTCATGKNAVLVPDTARTLDFANDAGVCSGSTCIIEGTDEYAESGDNVWSTWTGWPDGSPDDYLDGITIIGTKEVCDRNGVLRGPMGAAQDANTYYECASEHGAPTTTSGPSCLPYHRTAAINPENGSGDITIERRRIVGWGDGISLDIPVPAGTTIRVIESQFDYIHDDALEDDHGCLVDWFVSNSFFVRTFMLFATDPAGGASCSRVSHNYFYNSYARLYRFTNAYKQRAGHGGFHKPGESQGSVDWTLVNGRLWYGPISGDQVLFPEWEDVLECAGMVVVWSGTDVEWENALDFKNNRTNFTEINDIHNDCFTIVKREDRCPSCTPQSFLDYDLPELGNQSWNDALNAWRQAYFPPPPGCGMGAELAIVVPLLWWLQRRRRR